MGLAGEKVAPAGLQSDRDGVQSNGAATERVGQAQPDRLTPEVRLYNEPEGLIGGPFGVAVRQGEAQVGLRRRPTGRVRPLRRSGPRSHPDFTGLKRLGLGLSTKAKLAARQAIRDLSREASCRHRRRDRL